MIVKDNKFAPITADELWDSLMTVDDFVELLALQPKEPYIHDIAEMEYYDELRKEIHDTAVKWGFISK